MPPNHFESEVESFLEGSHGDRTHIKRADHHTVTPLCGTLLFCHGYSSTPRRLIPAHAGKIARPTSSGNPPGAHPRSRGENGVSAEPGGQSPGSSPLTRGKYPDVRAGRRRSGLIPAHAGKMRRWRPATRPTRAHPRSRGENPPLASWKALMAGSSPLTRGKCVDHDPAHAGAGLIPAHAGKIPSTGACRGRWRAHPRSRGENA